MSDLDLIEKVSAKEDSRYSLWYRTHRLVAVFIVPCKSSKSRGNKLSQQASPLYLLPLLTSPGALLTHNKKKGSGKPSRHPEPKLCDSVVTGLADSIR